MRKYVTWVLSLLLVATSVVPANSAVKIPDYFVSKSGSNKNPGTLAKPFLSIQKCATITSAKHNCKILAGTYFETVVSNSNVAYSPYMNASVVVDGRKTITGFQKYAENKYVAPVELAYGSTNQIFFSETPGVLAKWPNGGDEFHPRWAHLQAGTSTAQIVDPAIPQSLSGTGVVKLWSGNDAWSAQTASFNKAQEGALQISLDGDHLDQQITPNNGGLYYLFDNLTLMDEDFEWFYDRIAQKLYVQIPAGKNVSDYKIQAKVRDVAFDLNNKHNVTIQGLGIIASTITSNMSSHDNVLDRISASYVSQETRLRDDKFQHPWPGGFDFDRNFDTGIMVKGSHSTLKNSQINHSACNGVVVSGDHNVVSNNLISNVDTLFNNCSGVYLTGNYQTVTRNTIFNAGRSAIFPTNVWHPIDNVKSVAVTHSDISFNDLFNTALFGNDIGAIYMGGGVFTGLKIHHN